jgi:hypothetical protein
MIMMKPLDVNYISRNTEIIRPTKIQLNIEAVNDAIFHLKVLTELMLPSR